MKQVQRIILCAGSEESLFISYVVIVFQKVAANVWQPCDVLD
jgi:hypothetical protein